MKVYYFKNRKPAIGPANRWFFVLAQNAKEAWRKLRDEAEPNWSLKSVRATYFLNWVISDKNYNDQIIDTGNNIGIRAILL